MLVDGLIELSGRAGDLLGSQIYNNSPHGFLYCVIATTVVYALILPVILLVPKELIATADGEPNPVVEAEGVDRHSENTTRVRVLPKPQRPARVSNEIRRIS
jgi:hypothetical protein